MDENINETKIEETKTVGTRSEDPKIRKRNEGNLKARKITYYILGILEILFAFRLVFKILGANPSSPFVAFIYGITKIFIAPFAGIFRVAETGGIETTAVLEPPLLIAMAVYAALAWGIIRLIELYRKPTNTDTM